MSGITPGGSTLVRHLRHLLVRSVHGPCKDPSRCNIFRPKPSSWGWGSHNHARQVQRIGVALLVYGVLFSGAPTRASEDPHSYPRQRQAFVGSMCDQDWFQALYYLDNMLDLAETPELYRKALRVYRPRLQGYLAEDVELLWVRGCDRVVLPPTAAKENYVLPSRR